MLYSRVTTRAVPRRSVPGGRSRRPWKRLLLAMLYSLPLLFLLCAYQGIDAEAQELS